MEPAFPDISKFSHRNIARKCHSTELNWRLLSQLFFEGSGKPRKRKELLLTNDIFVYFWFWKFFEEFLVQKGMVWNFAVKIWCQTLPEAVWSERRDEKFSEKEWAYTLISEKKLNLIKEGSGTNGGPRSFVTLYKEAFENSQFFRFSPNISMIFFKNE